MLSPTGLKASGRTTETIDLAIALATAGHFVIYAVQQEAGVKAMLEAIRARAKSRAFLIGTPKDSPRPKRDQTYVSESHSAGGTITVKSIERVRNPDLVDTRLVVDHAVFDHKIDQLLAAYLSQTSTRGSAPDNYALLRAVQ